GEEWRICLASFANAPGSRSPGPQFVPDLAKALHGQRRPLSRAAHRPAAVFRVAQARVPIAPQQVADLGADLFGVVDAAKDAAVSRALAELSRLLRCGDHCTPCGLDD